MTEIEFINRLLDQDVFSEKVEITKESILVTYPVEFQSLDIGDFIKVSPEIFICIKELGFNPSIIIDNSGEDVYQPVKLSFDRSLFQTILPIATDPLSKAFAKAHDEYLIDQLEKPRKKKFVKHHDKLNLLQDYIIECTDLDDIIKDMTPEVLYYTLKHLYTLKWTNETFKDAIDERIEKILGFEEDEDIDMMKEVISMLMDNFDAWCKDPIENDAEAWDITNP